MTCGVGGRKRAWWSDATCPAGSLGGNESESWDVLACSTSVGLSDRWMAMACGLGCAIFGTSHSVASDCRCHLKSEVLFLFFSPFPLSF